MLQKEHDRITCCSFPVDHTYLDYCPYLTPDIPLSTC